MSSSGEDLIEIFKVVAAPSAVAVLGWWLRTQFSNIASTGLAHLVKHEREDERRHRDNLVRFTRIETRLGIPEMDDFHHDNGA
jgi:hypothetical protein